MDNSLQCSLGEEKQLIDSYIPYILEGYFEEHDLSAIFPQMEATLYAASCGGYQPTGLYRPNEIHHFIQSLCLNSKNFIDVLYVLCNGIDNLDTYNDFKYYILESKSVMNTMGEMRRYEWVDR